MNERQIQLRAIITKLMPNITMHLSDDLDVKLIKEKDGSALIQKLLREYFEKKEAK